MPKKIEVGVVYGAGVLQGLALVTFPAASGILTSSSDYWLSTSQYGGLFLPQAIVAVLAALSGAGLARRMSTKSLLLAGLVCDIASMGLLLASIGLKGTSAAYLVLLSATALLGAGFGLVVPALNTLAAAFFPQKVDRAILVLNALLGLGTTLAPVLVAVFTGLGAWWGLPLLTVTLLVIALVMALGLPLRTATSPAATASNTKQGLPARFWVFALAALLYGIVETMNGNWATLDMTKNVGATAAQASLALTAFWGMVTVGRLLFAGIQRWVPQPLVYRVLPFALAVVFLLLSRVEHGDATMGIVSFGLAGLACSALLPLTISFGEGELTTIAASVAGGLIAVYQIGYGIAAYGVGPLEELTGMSLNGAYVLSAGVAVALGLVAFVVAGRAPKTVNN